MADQALFAESRSPDSHAPAKGFDRLQELMRHGYVPDQRPLSDGLRLRHQFAPDLVLRPDGSVDVPLGQPLKLEPAIAPARKRRKRRWLRALLLVIGLALYTFLALAIVVGVMESL